MRLQGRLSVMTRKYPVLLLMMCMGLLHGFAAAQGELRFCLHSEPKTFDPLEGGRRCFRRHPIPDRRRVAAHEPSDTGSRAGTGPVLEGFERRKADHVQAAQWNLLL